jgi:hypothetical protein
MKIIQQISNWQAIRDYCNQIKHHAHSEQARCAKGRQNFWLQAEPNYSNGLYQKAVIDQHLWEICKNFFPQADLAQVYFADNNKGIDWHRDAVYCQPTARILNLGNAILESKTPGKITTLNLTGGELIEFDSKLSHKGKPLDIERVGIGIWTARIDINNPNNWSND